MKPILEILQKKLDSRKEQGLYRELSDTVYLVDLSSNDYLGFSELDNKKVGATGSRLISGNSFEMMQLETVISNFHTAESGLLFNSGYVANLGLFSTVPQRGDTIIYDELIHASIRDGIRLSNANSFAFSHNNLESLRAKLTNAKGTVFVAIESVYSMDGDSPDLAEMVEICKEFKANLIVDEAHAVGLVGEKGEGLVAYLNLQKDVFATVVTFGKALGCHGAIILGNNILRNYLINFCRSFIYTTAPSPETIALIWHQYERLDDYFSQKEVLKVINGLKKHIIDKLSLSYELIYGKYGSIISVVIPGNDIVRKVSKELESKGLFVKAVLSPTVQKGKERLRICLHTFNSINELNLLIDCLILATNEPK